MAYNGLSFPCVFEIPIYRVSIEKFYKEREEKINKAFPSHLSNEGKQKIHIVLITNHPDYNWQWRYNQIVGFIILCIGQVDIRYYLALPQQKRVKYESRAKFNVAELSIGSTMIKEGELPKDAFQKIITDLKSLHDSDHYVKKWFVDFEALKNTGPFIDWSALVYGNEIEFSEEEKINVEIDMIIQNISC